MISWKHITLALVLSLLAINTQANQFDTACTVDSECPLSSYYCDDEGFCQHKGMFKATKLSILGAIAIVIGSFASNAFGVGGGSTYVPIYLFLFQYNSADAIALSRTIIVGGAGINTITKLFQKHPNIKGRNLTDYGLGALIMPGMLGGSIVGNLLAKIVAKIVPLIFLIGFTLFPLIATTRTLKQICIKEKKTQKNLTLAKQEELKDKDIANDADNNEEGGKKRKNSLLANENKKDDENPEHDHLHNKDTLEDKNSHNNGAVELNQIEIPTETLKDTQRDLIEPDKKDDGPLDPHEFMDHIKIERHLPRNKDKFWKYLLINLAIVLFICGVFTTIVVLQGSKTMPSSVGIEYCKAWYWSINVFYIPAAILALVVAYFYNRRDIAYSLANYKHDHQLKKMTANMLRKSALCQVLKLIVASFVTGLISPLIGVGGGIVINPVLLELGVHPGVANATTIFFVLLTSIGTTIQYWVNGVFNIYQVLVFAGLGLGGGIFGSMVSFVMIKKNKSSWLVFFLILALVGAAIFLMVYLIIATVDNPKSMITFVGPC